MIKGHSDTKRGNLLLPHGLLFPISSKGCYMHHPTDRITHTTNFATPVMKHWLERETAQRVHHEGSIRRPIAPRVNTLNTLREDALKERLGYNMNNKEIKSIIFF